MARPFDFSDTTLEAARLRQWGICARCGTPLDDLWEEGHHVIPNQIGRVDVPADAFLRTADNCVILCDGCHAAAHGDDTRRGAVALADWYRYSHGKSAKAQHQAWRIRLENEWRRWDAR